MTSRLSAALFGVTIGLMSVTRAGAQEGSNKLLAHGEYLVNNVAMCGDCHTPRDGKGRPDLTHFLGGAQLKFVPPNTPGMANCAPAIAGIPFWKGEDAVRFLETGLTPKGKYAKPPMPRYRLSHEDALAVVTYLKSLPPASSNPCRPTEGNLNR